MNAQNRSIRAKNTVAKTVVRTTTVVELVTSLRLGHVTFESSSATSFAY